MAIITLKGLPELRRNLSGFSDRRFDATVATALTRSAVLSRDETRRDLGTVFDRPTPYTVNALYVEPAKADRLQASVKFKDDSATSGTPAAQYLMPHVKGGGRAQRRFEQLMVAAGHLPAGWFVVPGAGANLDAYGNISRGQIIQVLSQLRITAVAGSTRNMSFTDTRGALRAQKRAGGRFFVVPPGSRIAPGVYQREFIGRTVTPVMLFVSRVTYRATFDFFGTVQARAMRHLPDQVARAVQEQLARLAARTGG
jgi:hypothetical protein